MAPLVATLLYITTYITEEVSIPLCLPLGSLRLVNKLPFVYASSSTASSLAGHHQLLGKSLPIVVPNILPGLENVKTGVPVTRMLAHSTDNKFIYSVKSLRTSFRSGIDRSVGSIASWSKTSTVPATLRFVKKVPIVYPPGEKKEFPKKIGVYMHAKLDPCPGLAPFHPIWDPNMTHQRSPDGSPVYGVNFFDVGYFNSAGQFIVLFNLLLTKEKNEESFGFEFKATSFVPLKGVSSRSTRLRRNQWFETFDDKQITFDRDLSALPSEQGRHRNQLKFIVRTAIESGNGIAMMGDIRHYALGEVDTLQIHQEYFTDHCTGWYRHANGERKRHLKNGDLILITERYKAPTWGYLTYHGERTTKDTWASFLRGVRVEGLYGWKYSSELRGLESAEHQLMKDPTAGPPDQCIGFRACSIHCDPKSWKTMCQALEAESLSTLRR